MVFSQILNFTKHLFSQEDDDFDEYTYANCSTDIDRFETTEDSETTDHAKETLYEYEEENTNYGVLEEATLKITDFHALSERMDALETKVHYLEQNMHDLVSYTLYSEYSEHVDTPQDHVEPSIINEDDPWG